MKLPFYLKGETIKGSGTVSEIQFKITIRKIGIPILVFKTLRSRFDLKWYQWLWYPYLCLKMLVAG